MEGIAPTLQLCIETRMLVERGESLYTGLKKILPYLQLDIRGDVIRLLLQFEKNSEVQLKFAKASIYRQELLRIIAAGLLGEPIAVRLKEIEIEIQAVCEMETEKFISTLPVRAILPILLLQFPAFLILMFGPIVQEITRSFST